MKDLIKLIIICILGILVFILFPQFKLLKLLATMIIVLGFILWGIQENLQNNTFKWQILLEYLSLGLLALAMVVFLLYYD